MSENSSQATDSTQSKDSLRRFCKARRLNLSPEAVKDASAVVCDNLQDAIDWKKFKSIHVYQAIEDQHELDPQEFIDWLQKNVPDIEVYHQDLSGYFPAEQYDAVIVPCIASDKKGFRIGFGEGQYDKFLATQDEAKRFGICFNNSLFEDISAEPHDEGMDFIITEKRIIEL